MPAGHPLLSARQLERLQDFLEKHAVPADGMGLEMLDGYLHAIVIGPELILPSEWLPLVWSGAGDASGPGEDEKQSEDIVGLVMQHLNSIAAALRTGDGEWKPLILDYEDQGQLQTFAQEWALGFLQGVELRRKLWLPLESEDAFAAGWSAIKLLAYGPGDSELESSVRTQAQRDRLIDTMLNAVDALAVYWLDHDPHKPQAFRRAAPKVGRNDPCPCGSGKKFKHCCGAKATLH